jgi:hypothetical protein
MLLDDSEVWAGVDNDMVCAAWAYLHCGGGLGKNQAVQL